MAPFPGTDKISFCPYTLSLIAIIIPEREVGFKSQGSGPGILLPGLWRWSYNDNTQEPGDDSDCALPPGAGSGIGTDVYGIISNPAPAWD